MLLPQQILVMLNCLMVSFVTIFLEEEHLLRSGTRTGNALKQNTPLKARPRTPKAFLLVRDAFEFFKDNRKLRKALGVMINVGPDGGTAGGEIVFTGTPGEMAEHGQTITAEYLRRSL